jgi:hypothetical protein
MMRTSRTFNFNDALLAVADGHRQAKLSDATSTFPPDSAALNIYLEVF